MTHELLVKHLRPMKDTDWLIDRRSKTLYHLVAIKKHMDLYKRDVEEDWSRFSLFVGVGFSLWRAVFLTDPKEFRKNDVTHASKFLDFIIHDQIVNYPQDRDARGWSAGFYLNNAILRLHKLSVEMPRLPKKISEQMNRYWSENVAKANPRKVFDWCLVASLETFSFYNSKGSRRYPPRTSKRRVGKA